MNSHERYVAGGMCPSMTAAKTWCNLRVGHSGLHEAQRIPTPGIPIGPRNPARTYWEDR